MIKFTYASTLAVTAILALSACGDKSATVETPEVQPAVQSPLEAAISAERRTENAKRDSARHPKATLEFFGLAPNMTVMEIWPGGGWYADILASYAGQTGGRYIAAGYPETSERRIKANKEFLEKYADAEQFGSVSLVPFGKETAGLGAEGSVDMVVTFRNTHSWMGQEMAEKAFADFYAVLKPGGTLGLVQHRLPSTETQDPRAPTGYVQEAYVKQLAKEAGFEFVAASQVNANPKDTADHPLGVWTLPPRNRRESRDKSVMIEDGAKYEAIGESDRMTLKFRKPG